MQLAGTLSPATALTDATAFVAYLDAQPSVDKKKRWEPRVIAWADRSFSGPRPPFRIGSARRATFHGGGLATDKPESPSSLIPKMKAHFLIAIAENDDASQPDVKNVLKEAFAKAIYPRKSRSMPAPSMAGARRIRRCTTQTKQKGRGAA